MDFELLYRRLFTRKALSDYLEVTQRTIKNWEHSNEPPTAVVKLIQILNYDLSHLGKDWKGFSFRNSRLYTPENEPITAGSIRSIKYLRMTIDHLTKKKRLDNVVKKKFKDNVINNGKRRNNR